MKDSIKPVIKQLNFAPSLIVGRTNARISDDGITYDEAGVTYDDIRYTYGGIYGEDIYPQVVSARNDIPTNIHFQVNQNTMNLQFGLEKARISFFNNFNASNITPGTPTTERGMLIGILGMTYP